MTHGMSSLQDILENMAAGQVQGLWQQLERVVPYIGSHPDLYKLENVLKLKAPS